MEGPTSTIVPSRPDRAGASGCRAVADSDPSGHWRSTVRQPCRRTPLTGSPANTPPDTKSTGGTKQVVLTSCVGKGVDRACPHRQSQRSVVRRGRLHAALGCSSWRAPCRTPGGDPILTDETLEPFDPSQLAAGDVVGIGIHTKNTYRGYQLGQAARERGAWVVFGGIHASLFPDEAREHGGAHAVVTGDADRIWARVLSDFAAGAPELLYEGGRVAGTELVKPR